MSNNTQIQAFTGFESFQVETIRHTLAKDASPDQFNLFMSTAVAAGLNPMLNHIYCIVYGGKMSIQVSVEGILYLAKRVEGYEGIDTQLVHEHDEFEAYIDKDGKWVIGEHKIKFPRGKVLACYSIAYRAGFKPYTVFIEADEVQHHLSGTNAGNWKKYYNDFFKKTTTKRSAKGQFGIEINDDDAQEVGSSPEPYVRKDITEEVTEANVKQADEQPQTTVQAKTNDTEELWKVVGVKLGELGHTTKATAAKFLNENLKVHVEKATKTDLEKLIKVIDMEIAEKAADNDELE